MSRKVSPGSFFIRIRSSLNAYKQTAQKKAPKFRRLKLESLENRELLSATTWNDEVNLGRIVETPVCEETLESSSDDAQNDALIEAINDLIEDDGQDPENLTEEYVFGLSSLPTSTYTVYLDFNGHINAEGTYWQQRDGYGEIVTPAYSLDDDATSFSNDELRAIYEIWLRVSEDYAPFEINVTTMEPTLESLVRSDSNDSSYGVRVCIGGNCDSWYGNKAGGIAYVNSFTAASDTPVYVFQANFRTTKALAESISHEVGHTLGLRHDGDSSRTYYRGADGWAPIMGTAYYQTLSQFSKGEYDDATNHEDDLEIITTRNGFGYRSDDFGDSTATATIVSVAETGTCVGGVIERNVDVDFFKFDYDGGELTLDVGGIVSITNLDALVKLYDASGALLETFDPKDSLSVSFSMKGYDAGTYFLSVEGTGLTVGEKTIYTDYGSLGQYTITSSVGENFAVIFVGAVDAYQNDANFYYAARSFYEQLLSTHGLLGTNIYILYADGDTTGVSLNCSIGGTLAASDLSFATSNGSNVYAATEETLFQTFREISARTNDESHVLFYTLGYGSGNEGNADDYDDYLNGWEASGSRLISGAAVGAALAQIKRGYVTCVFNQSYSGGVLDDVLDSETGRVCIPNYDGSAHFYGIASTNHYEPKCSSADAAFPTVDFGEAFTNALTRSNVAAEAFKIAKFDDDFADEDDYENNAGTYYNYDETKQLVEHPWGAGERFSIFTTTSPDDDYETNDSFETACDLGTATSTVEVSNLIAGANQNEDWFKFTFSPSETSEYYVELRCEDASDYADVDFCLYDSSRVLVGSSTETTGTKRVSLVGLDAGTYYIRARNEQNVARGVKYELAIERLFLLTRVESSTTQPTTGTDITITLFVGENLISTDVATYQWSRVDLATNTTTEIVGAVDSTYTPGVEDVGYALRVDVKAKDGSCYSGVLSTTFCGVASSNDDEYESNDSLSEATNLGTITSEKTLDDLIAGSLQNEDWFKFTITCSGTQDSYVESTNASVDLRLYDASGALVASSTSGTEGEIISLKGLAAGEYYAAARNCKSALEDVGYSLRIVPPSAEPNLIFSRLENWDDSVILASKSNATTSETTFLTTENVWVRYAFETTRDVTKTFLTQVYVDSTLRWTTASRTRSDEASSSGSGFNLGMLSAGTHTIKIKLDCCNAVKESNENDNIRTITVTIKEPEKPNLAFFCPEGWSDSVIAASDSGATSGKTSFSTSDNVWIRYAFNTTQDVKATFATYVYVDGTIRNVKTTSKISADKYATNDGGFNLGKLSAGTHTIKVKLDAWNTIRETNENDSEQTLVITVVAPPQELTRVMPTTTRPNVGIKITTTLYSGSKIVSNGAATFQWFRVAGDGTETEIEGATSSSYKPVVADVGYYLRVVATPKENAGYVGSATAKISTKVNGDDSSEQNDIRQIATKLGTITSTKTLTNLVAGAYCDQDWYKFTITSAGTANSYVETSCTYLSSESDVVLYLYDSSGKQIDSSTQGRGTERISLDGLAAGTYYIKIVNGVRVNLGTPYALTIAWENDELLESAVDDAFADPSFTAFEEDFELS